MRNPEHRVESFIDGLKMPPTFRAFTNYYERFGPVAAQWNSKISDSNRGKMNQLREQTLETIRGRIALLVSEQDTLKKEAIDFSTPYNENPHSSQDVNLDQIQDVSNDQVRLFLELHPLVQHVLEFLQTSGQDISTKAFTKWEREYKRLLALNKQAESDAVVSYSSDDTGPEARGQPPGKQKNPKKNPDPETFIVGVNLQKLQGQIAELILAEEREKVVFDNFLDANPKPRSNAKISVKATWTRRHNKLEGDLILTKEKLEKLENLLKEANDKEARLLKNQTNIYDYLG